MSQEKTIEEKKTYVTTDKAGFVVAGRRVPAVYEDGKPATPQIGFDMELTDAEAEYELAQGTLVPKTPSQTPSKARSRAVDAPSKEA